MLDQYHSNPPLEYDLVLMDAVNQVYYHAAFKVVSEKLRSLLPPMNLDVFLLTV